MLRPRQGRTVWIRRVGRGQEVDRAFRGSIRGFAHGAQPIERPRQRELRRAQAIDEIAAPDAAGFLEGPKDRVDAGKAALDALTGDRLAGQHAMPLQ